MSSRSNNAFVLFNAKAIKTLKRITQGIIKFIQIA